MLSRVAEALFWVGRYVERAEDTARLLDVHFHEVLEDPGVHEAHACAVLLAVMGAPGDTAERHRDSRAVLELPVMISTVKLDRRCAVRRLGECPQRPGGAVRGDLGVPELHL